MNTSHELRILVGFVTQVAILSFSIVAQAQATLGDTKAKFPVTVEAVRAVIHVGEPLVLRITTENRTKSSVSLIPVHRFDKRIRSYDLRDFVVVGPEGGTVEWPRHLSLPIGDMYELVAGGHYVEIQTLRPIGLGQEKTLAWPKAGTYTAKMLPEDMQYPDIVFTVSESTGRDAEALELWKGYLGVTEKDAEARETLGVRLMAEYADTVYGQWATFDHTDLERERKVVSAERPKAPEGRDPAKLETFLEDIKEEDAVRDLAAATVGERLRYLIEECPDFPIKDECMLRLARTLPDKEARTAQYKAILKDLPDTPAAYMAAEELAKP